MKYSRIVIVLMAALLASAMAFGQATPLGPVTAASNSTTTVASGSGSANGGVAGFFFGVQLLDTSEVDILTVWTTGGSGLFQGLSLNAATPSVLGTTWLSPGTAGGSAGGSGLANWQFLNLQAHVINTSAGGNDGQADFAYQFTPIIHLSTGVHFPQGSSVSFINYGGTRNGVIFVPNTASAGLILPASNYQVLGGGIGGAAISNSFDVTHDAEIVIPEPASMTMLGGGLAFLAAGLAFRRRRRNQLS